MTSDPTRLPANRRQVLSKLFSRRIMGKVIYLADGTKISFVFTDSGVAVGALWMLPEATLRRGTMVI
jgi:hypothetical protein